MAVNFWRQLSQSIRSVCVCCPLRCASHQLWRWVKTLHEDCFDKVKKTLCTKRLKKKTDKARFKYIFMSSKPSQRSALEYFKCVGVHMHLNVQTHCACNSACGRKWQTAVHTLCASTQPRLQYSSNTGGCCDMSLYTSPKAALTSGTEIRPTGFRFRDLWSRNNSCLQQQWFPRWPREQTL